jgi:hypothetical protein
MTNPESLRLRFYSSVWEGAIRWLVRAPALTLQRLCGPRIEKIAVSHPECNLYRPVEEPSDDAED